MGEVLSFLGIALGSAPLGEEPAKTRRSGWAQVWLVMSQ